MSLLQRMLRGVIDADPVALGICVGLVVLLAAAFTVTRLRRRAP